MAQRRARAADFFATAFAAFFATGFADFFVTGFAAFFAFAAGFAAFVVAGAFAFAAAFAGPFFDSFAADFVGAFVDFAGDGIRIGPLPLAIKFTCGAALRAAVRAGGSSFPVVTVLVGCADRTPGTVSARVLAGGASR